MIMNDLNSGLMPKKVEIARGIGSDFWLPSPDFSEEPINEFDKVLPKGKKVFVTSGREAIYQIIKSLNISKKEKVLLPSYLCDSIIKPFLKSSIKFIFRSLVFI